MICLSLINVPLLPFTFHAFHELTGLQRSSGCGDVTDAFHMARGCDLGTQLASLDTNLAISLRAGTLYRCPHSIMGQKNPVGGVFLFVAQENHPLLLLHRLLRFQSCSIHLCHLWVLCSLFPMKAFWNVEAPVKCYQPFGQTMIWPY